MDLRDEKASASGKGRGRLVLRLHILGEQGSGRQGKDQKEWKSQGKALKDWGSKAL